MSTPDSAVHVVFDHGDEQQWAEWLAACRRAVLSFFPEGHPFYEAWLAAAVSDPAEVPKLVQAFVYRMDRQRAENERLRVMLGDCRDWFEAHSDRSGILNRITETLGAAKEGER